MTTTCGICQEEPLAEVGQLDCCDHSFCPNCILQWAEIESRCPFCKARFSTVTHRLVAPARAKTRSTVGSPGTSLGKILQVHTIPERNQVVEDEGPVEFAGASGDSDAADPMDDVFCMVCGGGDDEDQMILCDGCEQGCHTYCTGLSGVPDTDWLCSDCNRSWEPDAALPNHAMSTRSGDRFRRLVDRVRHRHAGAHERGAGGVADPTADSSPPTQRSSRRLRQHRVRALPVAGGSEASQHMDEVRSGTPDTRQGVILEGQDPVRGTSVSGGPARTARQQAQQATPWQLGRRRRRGVETAGGTGAVLAALDGRRNHLSAGAPVSNDHRLVEGMRTRWQRMHQGQDAAREASPTHLQEAAPPERDAAHSEEGDRVAQSWRLLDTLMSRGSAMTQRQRIQQRRGQRAAPRLHPAALGQAEAEADEDVDEDDACARAQLAEARARGRRLGPRTRRRSRSRSPRLASRRRMLDGPRLPPDDLTPQRPSPTAVHTSEAGECAANALVPSPAHTSAQHSQQHHQALQPAEGAQQHSQQPPQRTHHAHLPARGGHQPARGRGPRTSAPSHAPRREVPFTERASISTSGEPAPMPPRRSAAASFTPAHARSPSRHASAEAAPYPAAPAYGGPDRLLTGAAPSPPATPAASWQQQAPVNTQGGGVLQQMDSWPGLAVSWQQDNRGLWGPAGHAVLRGAAHEGTKDPSERSARASKHSPSSGGSSTSNHRMGAGVSAATPAQDMEVCSSGDAAAQAGDVSRRNQQRMKAEAAKRVKGVLHLLYASKDISKEQFTEAARIATHTMQADPACLAPVAVQSALQDLGVFVPLSRLQAGVNSIS